MNIHFIGPEKVTTDLYRRRTGQVKASSAGTKPPRTREGQTHPGGKQLRRAFRALERRRRAQEAIVSTMTKGRSINPAAYQKPGSMKTRAR